MRGLIFGVLLGVGCIGGAAYLLGPEASKALIDSLFETVSDSEDTAPAEVSVDMDQPDESKAVEPEFVIDYVALAEAVDALDQALRRAGGGMGLEIWSYDATFFESDFTVTTNTNDPVQDTHESSTTSCNPQDIKTIRWRNLGSKLRNSIGFDDSCSVIIFFFDSMDVGPQTARETVTNGLVDYFEILGITVSVERDS
jgi:hypothetical protein